MDTARTRRQIDQLKAARDQLACDNPKRASYEEEIRRCWRLYEARNRELAHLAANLLLLFASVWGCSPICGERLSTLKSTGPGRGVRGKWRNWRNNTTVRSQIWSILRYKCHLLGIRFRSETPARHLSYLPALRGAGPDLPLASPPAPQRCGEVGTLALLRPLWLQWGPRLLRGPQHRPARYRLCDVYPKHRHRKSLLRD